MNDLTGEIEPALDVEIDDPDFIEKYMKPQKNDLDDDEEESKIPEIKEEPEVKEKPEHKDI